MPPQRRWHSCIRPISTVNNDVFPPNVHGGFPHQSGCNPPITAIYCCSLNSQIIGTTPHKDHRQARPQRATQGPKGQSAGAWPWSAGRLVVFELWSTAETTHTAWSQRSAQRSAHQTAPCPKEIGGIPNRCGIF